MVRRIKCQGAERVQGMDDIPTSSTMPMESDGKEVGKGSGNHMFVAEKREVLNWWSP